MARDFDVCVIGSGAGGGPVALRLAEAGYSVVVLEKGPWLQDGDFTKDELSCCRRSVYTPKTWEEPQVIEDRDRAGKWRAQSTADLGRDLWNGNCVGGATNFMSGYFHRLKPDDFRLLSAFGPREGANLADWPIPYEELEPYYAIAEREIGISGRVVGHPHAEPRSTPDFPFPPTAEHPVSQWIDASCRGLGLNPIPVPRAILPYPAMNRGGCSYSDYCGSYGCATGAKGSSRVALLARAVASGNCEVRPWSMVYKLESDGSGRVNRASYRDQQGNSQQVDARIFVVACHAIETARLLLSSPGSRHPQGLGNATGQVGKNLIFSAGGSGSGDFSYAAMDRAKQEALKVRGPFVNRALQDWYYYTHPETGKREKGGTIDFLFQHDNPIARANAQKWEDGELIWGTALKKKLKAYFTGGRRLRFEVFCDWTPVDDCFVSLDPIVKDKWGMPVARVRTGYHPHDLVVGRILAKKGEVLLQAMGAENVQSSISGEPPTNLVAGGCRFGADPETSVLDRDCRAHTAENLYVTDGSFMPTGGSVPYTWTIYANAFRVADRILDALGAAG